MTPKLYSKLLLGLLIHYFLQFSGRYCRPLLLWILNRWIKGDERKNPDKLSSIRLMLHYNLKSSWQDVLPTFDTLSTTQQKNFTANAFVYLYFANIRIDEAKEAAHYWNNVSDEWVRAHLIETEQALPLLRQLNSWWLYPQEKENLSFEESMQVMNAITQIQGERVREWRDSRVALALLERIAKDRETAVAGLVEDLELKRNPVTYQHIVFDHEVAYIIGMSDEEFKEICLHAETL